MREDSRRKFDASISRSSPSNSLLLLKVITSITGSERNNLDPVALPVEPEVGLDLMDPLDLLGPGPWVIFDLPCPESDPAPFSCPALLVPLELLTCPEFDPAPVFCPALPGLLELYDALVLDPLFQCPL